MMSNSTTCAFPHTSAIKVATLNIRSLRHKVHEVADLLSDHNIDVIGITETWCDETVGDGELLIDGYLLHRSDRSGRRGGGVAVYCRASVVHRPRPDLDVCSSESIWIELGAKKRFLFCCCYRPPHEPVSYWDNLDTMLSQPFVRQRKVVLVGDLNVDVSLGTPGSHHSQHYNQLSTLCQVHALHHTTAGPTRIALRGPPSTLDLILTPADTLADAQVTHVPFTDHSMVTGNVDIGERPVVQEPVWSRHIRKINIESFRADIADAQLSSDISADANTMWDTWLNTFTQLLDKHAPLRVYVPKKRPTVPWMNSELLSLIGKRNRLHRVYIKQRTQDAYDRFKAARAAASYCNRRLKSRYFQDRCQASTNSRSLWRVINTVTGRRRPRQTPACTPEEISNTFAQIVTDLDRPPVLSTPDHNLPFDHRLCQFKEVDEATVEKLLRTVDETKATGSDDVPGILLKSCSDLLAPSLTSVFNKSLTSGVFPDRMKLAHVCPLFKGGDSTIPTNYRPVSLLSVVSKLLERIVHDQLAPYLSKWNILPDAQYAFRQNRSTEDALVLALDRLWSARDAGLHSASVFLDLSKAFDKVQHSSLIELLYSIGITGPALQWFIDYLSRRKQVVVIGSSRSSTRSPSCGVPQGSVLGPILFSLYVKDLPSVLPANVSAIQFADDIMLSSVAEILPDLEKTMSAVVADVSCWLKQKNLILNPKKSQVLVCSPPRFPSSSTSPFCVHSQGTPLPNVQSASYLGLQISADLTWDGHMNKVSSKVSKKIGALRRSKNSLSEQARFKFYSAAVRTDLLYASNAFASSLSSACWNRIIRLQKKGLRAIFGWPPWAHTSGIFSKFKERPIKTTHHRKLAYLVWRRVNGIASDQISELFTIYSPSLRTTRGSSSNCVALSLAKTSSGLNRPSFCASLLWNSLPAGARLSKSKDDFFSLLPENLGL